VRFIFRRFAELGSSLQLVGELRARGWTTKAWTAKSGNVLPGKLIDTSQIYKLLCNRTYLGELRHRDQWFVGAHEAIVSRAQWDAVHAILATNGRRRGNATRAKEPFLLKGLVFGPDGRALTPTHTTKKNGRRYRYYLSTRDVHEGSGASGLPRLPAAELEATVVEQLRCVLRSPRMVDDVVARAVGLDRSLDEAQVTVAMTQVDRIWEQLFPAEQARIVRLLVERVVVTRERIDVRMRPSGIEELAHQMQPVSAEAAA
jgi:hypothetical protein